MPPGVAGAVGAPVRVGAAAADVEVGSGLVRETVGDGVADEPHAASRTAATRVATMNGVRACRTMGGDHRRADGELATRRAELEIHALEALEERRRAADRPYLEVQRSPDLSTGLYALPAAGVDRQRPHTEDEIYYVIAGRAVVSAGDEEAPVGPGDVVFVGAGVPHRFHAIAEDLRLLVVFGPAENSRASDAAGQAGI
jgi:mannose-6-phosphate isomerase-like protein (cupin superfamily)